MDNVLKIIKQRRSIREFQKKGIPEDAVSKLIDALIWAPSAGNLQARKFLFITEPALKKRLAVAALNQTFISHAPLIIVGCTNLSIGYRYGDRGIHLYAIQDVACSIMNMMLVACELGIGTVWVGAFRETEVSKMLELPHTLRPVAIVPVGYPETIPHAPPRVPVDEAVEFR